MPEERRFKFWGLAGQGPPSSGPVTLHLGFAAAHEGVHDVIHVLDERQLEGIFRGDLVLIHLTGRMARVPKFHNCQIYELFLWLQRCKNLTAIPGMALTTL